MKNQIVCLGDSLTAAYEITEKKCWVSLLGESLNIRFINSGISGDTTSGMLARLRYDVIDHSPSILILMGGTNDLYLGIEFKHLIANLYAISRQMKHHQTKTIIGIPPPIFPLIAEPQDSLFTHSMEMSRTIEAYQNVVRKFCLEDCHPMIDFSKGMTRDDFMNDGVHPNEQGHHKMWQIAATALENIL